MKKISSEHRLQIKKEWAAAKALLKALKEEELYPMDFLAVPNTILKRVYKILKRENSWKKYNY